MCIRDRTEGCILPGGHEGDCELVPVTETVEEETEERTEVEKLQERINHLPSVEALESMTDEEKAVVYEELNAICDAVDACLLYTSGREREWFSGQLAPEVCRSIREVRGFLRRDKDRYVQLLRMEQASEFH